MTSEHEPTFQRKSNVDEWEISQVNTLYSDISSYHLPNSHSPQLAENFTETWSCKREDESYDHDHCVDILSQDGRYVIHHQMTEDEIEKWIGQIVRSIQRYGL